MTWDHDRRVVLASLAGLALAPLGGCANQAAAVSYRERADRMRADLKRLASYAQASVPGFQVACILDGEIAWTEGLGVRNTAGDPVTADTVFDLASLTKTLFGTAVLRLVERGVLDLDRPLVDYGSNAAPNMSEQAKRVTARQVLSHQTGLPNWRPFEPGSPVSFLRDPGTGFTYSGEGFFWLQQVVEEITGAPLPRLVEREVLEPAGMVRSAVVFKKQFSDNYAQGFRRLGEASVDSWNKRNADRVRERLEGRDASLEDLMTEESWMLASLDAATDAPRPSPDLAPANAAASLQGPAVDYARLLSVYMEGGAASGMLRRQTVAEALEPVTPINDHISYGLGWRLEDTAKGRSFWHSGYNDGFHSFALGDPEGRYGVVVLTNSDRGNRLRWPVVYSGTGHGEAAIVS